MPPGIKKDTAPTVTLLAVTGMSPAILTETIWALAHLEGIIPARIIAVTTTVGRNKAARKNNCRIFCELW